MNVRDTARPSSQCGARRSRARTVSLLAGVGAVFFLGACGNSVYVARSSVPVGYEEFGRSILTTKDVSAETASVAAVEDGDLGGLVSGAGRVPGVPGVPVVNVAEALVAKGRELERSGQYGAASGYYLDAVRLGGVGGDAFGRALAAHATGRFVVSLFEAGESRTGTQTIKTPSGEVRLVFRGAGPGVFGPSYFDSVSAVDSMVFDDDYFRTRVEEEGEGAKLVGRRKHTAERLESDPHVGPSGRSLPVTATLEFMTSNRAELVLHDVSVADRARIGGERQKLATDFTAPLADLMSYSFEGNVGIAGMLRPDENRRNRGLFMLEPVRRDKVPVVFVHGLLSRPATFKNTFNELLANREIREGYQFWFYRYPTGVPVIFSGAGLREELRAVRERHGTEGALGQMVVIGHSMGGLLTSLQIRRSREEDWSNYFTGSLSRLRLDPERKSQLAAAIQFEANPAIERVVFVASPHRGSPRARRLLGRIGAGLIRAPIDMMRLQTPELFEAATDLGRSVLRNTPTGINSLNDENPTLESILNLSVRDGVKIHSIIGNRGKDEPLKESADGFVPYWSSHLEGVESEKIVPSGHDAHNHPEAIAEIERILLLHLDEPK